ncbi:MAG: SelB C-terminal domain-containing protein [Acidimicrobiales bacterium]
MVEAGHLGLDIAKLSEQDRATLTTFDDITVDAGMATLGEAPDPLANHPWLAALEAAPFNPPGPDGVDRGEIRHMIRRGTVIERDKVYFAASALQQAAQLVANKLATQPEGITVSEVRDLLDTSRKYVLPLLNELDQTGMTRRRGDVRIAGPRLPEPTS